MLHQTVCALTAILLLAPSAAAAESNGQDCIPSEPRPEVSAKTRVGGETVEVPLNPAARTGQQPEGVTIKVRRPDGTEDVMHTPPCPVK